MKLELNGHIWEKKNMVGIRDKTSLYDLWQCSNCGKKYKRRTLDWKGPTDKCRRKPTIMDRLDDGDKSLVQP